MSARRSFVHHRLQAAGAVFAEGTADGGAPIALRVKSVTDDTAAVQRMALVDLSPLPRIGYKGAGAPAWLQAQGVVLPGQPNRSRAQEDGTLVAALSAEEHLLLAPLNNIGEGNGNDNGEGGELCARTESAWSLDTAARCYQLPRADSHCWFAVSGDCASDMLAKLCGVDLRPAHFAVDAVAQTSLARVNAILIRPGTSAPQPPVFYLLTDSASAEYVWDCLLDAMKEFNGAIAGADALRALTK